MIIYSRGKEVLRKIEKFIESIQYARNNPVDYDNEHFLLVRNMLSKEDSTLCPTCHIFISLDEGCCNICCKNCCVSFCRYCNEPFTNKYEHERECYAAKHNEKKGCQRIISKIYQKMIDSRTIGAPPESELSNYYKHFMGEKFEELCEECDKVTCEQKTTIRWQCGHKYCYQCGYNMHIGQINMGGLKQFFTRLCDKCIEGAADQNETDCPLLQQDEESQATGYQ